MKKHPKQKQTSHAENATPEADGYVAKVPVKISIGHTKNILTEYEDVIDIEFTDTTPEGRKNIGGFHFFKKQGLSTVVLQK